MVDSPNNRCVTCNDRFFASESSCLPVSQSCDGYNSVGKCTSCKADLIIQTDGTCLTPPPPQVQVGQYNQNQAQANQAQQYGDQNHQIQNSNQFSQGVTTSSQSSLQGNTQQSSSAGFAYGQTINQGSQQSSQASSSNGMRGSDGNCREYFAGKCSKCSSRYYVGPDGRCVPVNPLCKDSNSAGECTGCYPGYRVDTGKCIIATSQDVNCKSFKGQQCNECYQGFFYSQNDRACKKLNPLCKTSNLSTGACTGCYPGYNLNPSSGAC